MPLKAKPLPPAADLWDRYSYNPLTGELFSRLHPRRKALGGYDRAGYLQTKIEWYGERTLNVLIHRVIWKWCSGSDPADTIDHIDQNRDNNRIQNLRIADMTTQRRNRRGYVHLSKDQENDLIRRHLKGESIKRIAETTGLNRERVTRLIHLRCS